MFINAIFPLVFDLIPSILILMAISPGLFKKPKVKKKLSMQIVTSSIQNINVQPKLNHLETFDDH